MKHRTAKRKAVINKMIYYMTLKTRRYREKIRTKRS